jgi:hypothetical protein
VESCIMATLYHSKRKSQTTLNNGGSLSAGGVSVTVLSAAALPAAPYLAYIEPGVVGQEELVAVTSVASNTLTIIRGLDGTAGVSHPDGSAIKNITASLAWEDLLSIFQLHKHTGADNSAVIVDATAPGTQAFGDTAAAGSGTKVPRIDHVHGMPLYPAYNMLYNGDFSVAQVTTSATMVHGQVTLDGWHCYNNTSAVMGHTQLTAPSSSVGAIPLSSYSYITLATADTSIAAGELAAIYQLVEGWDGREIGTYGAAFSGWFFGSRPGGSTYSISLRNNDASWSCVREFTLPQSVWTYVTLTFPPPYGTASFTGNYQTARAWYFTIALAAGSSSQTATTGSWINLNRTIGPNQTNNVDSAANDVLYMHALNLIPGQQPQPFFPVPFSQQLLRCKRYRQVVSTYPDTLSIAQATSTNQFSGTKQLEVEMLGTPTMTLSAASHWNAFNAGSTNIALTALTFTPTKRMINYIGTVASGLVAGNAALIWAANTSALLYAEAYPT